MNYVAIISIIVFIAYFLYLFWPTIKEWRRSAWARKWIDRKRGDRTLMIRKTNIYLKPNTDLKQQCIELYDNVARTKSTMVMVIFNNQTMETDITVKGEPLDLIKRIAMLTTESPEADELLHILCKYYQISKNQK